jgi:glucose-1-phosphate thymidylyltransferase
LCGEEVFCSAISFQLILLDGDLKAFWVFVVTDYSLGMFKNTILVAHHMYVIIPVAGKGTRLRPHTHTTAKPLVHVAGKSVLQHILDRLSGLPIDELILITGHLGEQFKELKAPYPIRMIAQEKQDGTASAVGLAKPFVKGEVFIVFADTVFDTDLSIVKTTKADGLVWAKEVEDYQRFGVVVHKDGVMQRIVEKPSEPISKLANIGMYWFRDGKAFFDENEKVLAGPPGKGGEWFMTDTIQRTIDSGKTVRVEPVDGWYDCGTGNDLLETNKVLLAQESKERAVQGSIIIPPVWFEDGVTIERSVIGPNVSIAAGSKVSDSIVSDAILNASAVVEHANITRSILGTKACVHGKARKVNLGDDSTLEL